jgi:hypothetical protein
MKLHGASIVLAALIALPALAGAELVLQDGQVLKGESIERKGDLYELVLPGGGRLPVPAGLVRQIHLSGDGSAVDVSIKPAAPPKAKTASKTKPPAKTAKAATPKPAPRAPGGLTAAPPQTLAGPPGPVRPPELKEQLGVMRNNRSVFAPSVINPGFTPHSDWDLSLGRNEFRPSRWAPSVIDPNWSPRPAYTTESDVTGFNPVRWFEAPIDPRWYPSDGFRRPPEP